MKKTILYLESKTSTQETVHFYDIISQDMLKTIVTDHCGKCYRDKNKRCIAQVNIQCRSKSRWYNCEKQSPSVALVVRKVNKTSHRNSWSNIQK